MSQRNKHHFLHKENPSPQSERKRCNVRISCDIKPNKEGKECTRLTAGGDRINDPEDVVTPTADMTLVKIFLNSIISTKGAKCVMLDLKDFYLNTPMKRYEYMRLKIRHNQRNYTRIQIAQVRDGRWIHAL